MTASLQKDRILTIISLIILRLKTHKQLAPQIIYFYIDKST